MPTKIEVVWLGEHLGFGRFEVKLFTDEDGSKRISIWDWKTNSLASTTVIEVGNGQGQTEAQANG